MPSTAPRFTALGAVLALAMLVRPDMALPVGACLVYLLPALRRAPARAWLPGALLLVGALGGYQAFRLVAYIVDEIRPDAIYLNGSMEPHLRQGAPDYELVEGLFWLRRDSEKVRWEELE